MNDVAGPDDDAGRQRQLGAEAGEQLGEGRDDLPQNDGDDQAGDGHDRDRVDHRGLDLALQLDVLLDVDREALENRVEDTARLAGRHHVDVEGVERLGVPAHRVGQRRAALDLAPGREDRLREALVRLLPAEDVETLHQRQAGVDHDRELAGEDGQVLGRDLPGPELLLALVFLGLLLDRADLGHENLLAAEHRDGGVDGIRQPLAVDQLARPGASCKSKSRHRQFLLHRGRSRRPATSAPAAAASAASGRGRRRAPRRCRAGSCRSARPCSTRRSAPSPS